MENASPIDEQKIRAMALCGASDQEIAEALQLPAGDLRGRFEMSLIEARATRRVSLRRRQTNMAAEGNVTMLVFLGKQELGQFDRPAGAGDAEPQMDPKVG
jgi:hypothetical protein